MRLRLTVISDHRQELADRADHEFSESGGVIGRSATADWSLPDPTKTLSARHTAITFADGTFRVTDTSTNGVYLNSVDVPLGRGATMPLRNGDTLYFGPYVVRVEVIADALDGRQRLGLDGGWKAVCGDQSPLPNVAKAAALDDLVGGRRGPESDGLLASSAASPISPRPRPVQRRQESDPIAGLDALPTDGHAADDIARREDDLLSPVSPAPASFGLRPLVSPLPADGMAQPLPLPIIPPNFDPLSGSAVPHRPPDLPIVPSSAPFPMPPVARSQPPLPPPRAPMPAQPAEFNENAPPTDVMALLRLRALGAGGEAPVAEHPPAGGDLLSAIGVDPAALAPDTAERAIAALAAFVLEAAGGLVEVLETRRTLKDELRLDHTRLGATHNNPFKFFATGREAIRQMLVLNPPGFASLAEGAEEAFADVREHEIATMTAIQAAAATLLGRLSPAAIEAQSEGGGFLGRVDKARLWDRFVELHGRTVETLDVAVGELVAQHYARALQQRTPDRRKEFGS
jgi:type VI secretion system FHA domain protein